MRFRVALAVVAVGVLSVTVAGQKNKHLNPVVDLLEAKLPIFGTTAPSVGGTRTSADAAKDMLAHPDIDFFFYGGMERGLDTARNGGPTPLATFTQLADGVAGVGPIADKPFKHFVAPMMVKSPNISKPGTPGDDKYIDNISRQLNAGVTAISFVEVDSAEELKQGIAAMRFKSKGGTRPDAVGDAPRYWGLSESDYRKKADVWPFSADAELVTWAIVESKEGIANVREIAQVKGLGILIPGAGTLGSVYTKPGPDGRNVRDDEAWEAAIDKVLAACKEFKVPCGYPAFDNDIEMRMQQGFSAFIIQNFGDRGFKAVEIGRRVSGRDKKK